MACIDCDCGACVIRDPASEKSSVSSKCTKCSASVFSACTSALITTAFNSKLAFFARASSTSELFDGAQRSISFTSVTVLGSDLPLCVRAPSNSVMIGCAQCSLFPTNMTLFEFSLVLCLRAPTNSVEMGCALCSSGILASVDISLVTDSSKSW